MPACPRSSGCKGCCRQRHCGKSTDSACRWTDDDQVSLGQGKTSRNATERGKATSSAARCRIRTAYRWPIVIDGDNRHDVNHLPTGRVMKGAKRIAVRRASLFQCVTSSRHCWPGPCSLAVRARIPCNAPASAVRRPPRGCAHAPWPHTARHRPCAPRSPGLLPPRSIRQHPGLQ